MKSPAVTTKAPKGEPYDAFERRVAADSKRVKAKAAALDKFIPICRYCGQTCDQIESGKLCKENNAPMLSRWAHEKAKVEWFGLGHFGGAWPNEVERLAALLDRVRAAALSSRTERTPK